MKFTEIILLTIIFSFGQNTQAQVAINEDGSAPTTGSIFHVKGDNNGTALQAMFIQSSSGNIGIGTINPETNLNIYSNADNNGLTLQTSDNTFNHGIRFRNSGESYTWNVYRKDAGSNHADLIFANGLSTDLSTFTEVVTFKNGGNVGIGTINPDASAALDISSTNRGFLPPRMTASQMNAIVTPATGLCVFNTDVNAQCYYNGSSWDCYDSQSLYDNLFLCGNIFKETSTKYQFSTVLIGDQCWMAENLNVGSRIDGSVDQSNNGTIEKYCYDDDDANCDIYGGLYQWNEMMQYITTEGDQGICPIGWHIPTDDEWKTMEMELGMTQAQADMEDWRGTNEGGKMKETGIAHWSTSSPGATNSSGFTALPGGLRDTYGPFYYHSDHCYLWSSSEKTSLTVWNRSLQHNYDQVRRNYYGKAEGYSVRCLKN